MRGCESCCKQNGNGSEAGLDLFLGVASISVQPDSPSSADSASGDNLSPSIAQATRPTG